MRKIVRASLLVLALSVSAYADGNMGNPVAPPELRTAVSATQTGTESLAEGDMGNGATVSTTEVALSLLQTLLTLF